MMDFWQRQRLMFNKEESDKIHDTVALIAGAGGLGTHQAVELQRIGIGKIYLVDYDRVEPSNLNRQVLYGRDDIGCCKVDRAKQLLDGFNLGTEIVTINEKITEKMKLPADVDIILDALDNFTTRYQLERLAAGRGIPLIHGGINSWYGQLTTIIPGKSKSLKEIFGKIDGKNGPQKEIPAFSPVVSIIASLQVIEGIKVILQREDTLINKLLLIDLNDYSIDLVEL